MKENKGFSLIELIVVLAILAILAGILVGATGAVGNRKLNKYTSLLDEFMKKTRIDAMAQNDVCGLRIYEENDVYYVETYGEINKNGSTEYKVKDKQKLGDVSDIEISIAKKDKTDKIILTNESYIKIQYARSSGAITGIKVGTEENGRLDRTVITLKRGERIQCIEMIPATGKHSVQ